MPDLVAMVNESYAVRAKDLFPTRRRLKSNECLSEEIASPGVTVVAFHVAKDFETGSMVKREIVATASAKKWTEKSFLSKDYDAEETRSSALGTSMKDILNWEISCVAARCGSQYERRGLVAQALSFLEKQLGLRLKALHGGEHRQDRKFLIRTVKEHHGDYFIRRGFKLVETIFYDKGTLESFTSFQEVVMEKEMSSYDKDEPSQIKDKM